MFIFYRRFYLEARCWMAVGTSGAEETPPTPWHQSTVRVHGESHAPGTETRHGRAYEEETKRLTSPCRGEMASLWRARASITNESHGEVKVARLVKCHLEQKAGYGHHASFLIH